jgi:hypothetical protein
LSQLLSRIETLRLDVVGHGRAENRHGAEKHPLVVDDLLEVSGKIPFFLPDAVPLCLSTKPFGMKLNYPENIGLPPILSSLGVQSKEKSGNHCFKFFY